MRVFIDACCLYAAGRSPGGGSAKILSYSRDYGLTVLMTMAVIAETKKNLVRDRGPEAFSSLVAMARKARLEMIPNPSHDELKALAGITVEKDLHVLAGAVKGKADVLVTLDRKHLLKSNVRDAFPFKIMDTTDFWKAIREGSL